MPTKTVNEVKTTSWYRYQPFSGYPMIGHCTYPNSLSRTSGPVPNWRTRIARCDSATSNLYVVGDRIIPSMYYKRVKYYNPNQYNPWMNLEAQGFAAINIGHLSIPDPGWSIAMQGAKSGWTRKLDALRTAVLAGVTAGESRESYRMIKDRAGKINSGMESYLKATLRLRKGLKIVNRRLPSAKQVGTYLQEQNNLYLEYSFGWAPLMGEIQAWRKEIFTSAFRGYRDRETLLSSFTHTVSASDLVEIDVGRGIGLLPNHWKRETIIYKSMKYYGAHLLETLVEDRRLDGIGLQPGQFVCSVWELIPWSFVVDYFTNVGLVLQSLTSKSARLAWSQTTQVTRTVTRCTSPSYVSSLHKQSASEYLGGRYGGDVARTYTETVSGSIERSSVILTRAPGTPSDMTPELEFRKPNAHQAFNVLSLLTGKYRAFQKLL